MSKILNRLRTLADPSVGNSPCTKADFIQFLNDNVRSDHIALYASVRHLFLHGVLVPRAVATSRNIDDLLNWHGNPFDSWSIGFENRIGPPLSTFGNRGIASGEQIVFLRSFSGIPEKKPYVEIWQKFIHVLDLHHMREPNAWCRLDRHGDIEEVVKVIERPERDTDSGEMAVLIQHDCLAQYAEMTDSILLFMFDFVPSRALLIDFADPDNSPINLSIQEAEGGMLYRCREENGNLIWAGGVQLSPVSASHSESVETHKKYETYLAFNWKNDEIREISCSPNALSNYFTESDLPFGMSPVFFRSEVLSRFKADTEKYKLSARSIDCRGAWHLQSYDINEANQVHTYLVYLAQLPHEEQLYWKAFNERPRAPISERAFETDFQGNFSFFEHNPLASLKEAVSGLQVPWWKLRTENEIQWAHYPVTGSNDEWRNEIQRLDRLIVEGLEERWLRRHAKELGASLNDNDRSITLLEKCLMGHGVGKDGAAAVVRPFRELRDHRSKFAHAAGQEARRLKEQAFESHGGYRQHYTQLVDSCCDSMKRVNEVLSKSEKG